MQPLYFHIGSIFTAGCTLKQLMLRTLLKGTTAGESNPQPLGHKPKVSNHLHYTELSSCGPAHIMAGKPQNRQSRPSRPRTISEAGASKRKVNTRCFLFPPQLCKHSLAGADLTLANILSYIFCVTTDKSYILYSKHCILQKTENTGTYLVSVITAEREGSNHSGV